MPELPEVEIARRNLERWFKGHALSKAVGTKTRIFRGAKLSDFEKLQGPLTEASRKGKYLMLRFGDRGVLAHLGMTGKFVKRAAGVDEPFSRARLLLDDGEVIHFRDARMFGRIEPAPAQSLADLKAIKQLGFDPLNEGVDGPKLKAALGKSKQDLKVALMDQSRMAGMGNIHAAEALFRAKLHPSKKPPALSDDDWARLAEAVKASIAFGLAEQESDEPRYVEEDPSQNPFLVYGHGGEPCGTCGTIIKQFDQGGRSTYFCPGCQPGKKSAKSKQAKRPAKRSVRAKRTKR
jgi:formamidopyrimidine-DNA glycosylase